LARLIRDWQFRGMNAVILENRRIRATVLPGAGARIFQLIDKQNDVDLLWRHPRREPSPAVLGSPGADLWWTGGIDDIFPTDFPCVYRNEQLPYLGELWTNDWSSAVVEDSGGTVEMAFSTRTVISPFEVTKRMKLRGDDDFLSVTYSIRNMGFDSYDWFFGIHPGVEVAKGSRLLFPIREALIDDAWPSGIFADKGTRYQWPLCPNAAGGVMDLRDVPGPDAGWWSFHYGLELSEGWLGVYHPRLKNAFCMTFDPVFFRSLLLYLGYGGWRNTYSIIPQIATAWPGNLADVISAGKQHTLAPGKTAETSVGFHCLTSLNDENHVKKRIDQQIEQK
jgi:hypothetical protein